MICENDKTTALLQVKQLEILKELNRVCNICGVKYFLATGSCLGAVRHKGFIPWDDDIDVCLFWDEAEKLLKNTHLFAKKYFLQCQKTDPEYKSTCFRLRDSSTSYFSKDELGQNINHGIYIDIYILYPYSDSWLRAYKIIYDSFIYRILFAGRPPRNHGKLASIVGKGILSFYSGLNREKKINKILNEYKYNGGKNYVASYFGLDVTPFSCIKYPGYLFEEQTWLPFEDIMAPCPKNPEEYCKFRYGNDYMELPPIEKRVSQHDYVFVDVEKPFTEFKGKYY